MADGAEENDATQNPRAPFPVQNPCRFFQEIVRALLECLGLESWCKSDKTGVREETSSGETSSSPSDPPSSAAGSPAVATSLGRAPPRPVISPGPGPQTNTNVN